MMITDLRVVGIYHERPSFRQLIRRCGGIWFRFWDWDLGFFGDSLIGRASAFTIGYRIRRWIRLCSLSRTDITIPHPKVPVPDDKIFSGIST